MDRTQPVAIGREADLAAVRAPERIPIEGASERQPQKVPCETRLIRMSYVPTSVSYSKAIIAPSGEIAGAPNVPVSVRSTTSRAVSSHPELWAHMGSAAHV